MTAGNTEGNTGGASHTHTHYHKQETATWMMALMSLVLMVICTGYLFSNVWQKPPERIILCGTEMVTPDKDFYIRKP